MIKSNLKKYQILNSDTISEGIKQMNKTKIKLLFVVKKNKNFIGTLSDGDIRRATANDISLNKNINKIFNQKPIIVKKNHTENDVRKIFKIKKIFIIPVIDKKKVIGFYDIRNFINVENQSKLCPVLIMAGGYGKRSHPLTKKIPKPMLPVKGKPLLEVILKKISNQGFKDIYISTHYKHKIITDYFKDGSKLKLDIKYIYEKLARGTAGSLKILKKKLDNSNNILLMNSDILTDAKLDQLLLFHENNKADMTMVVKTINITNEYGVVEKEGINFHNIDEKPSFFSNINAGIYAINLSGLKKMNFKKKTNIIDVINYLKKKKKKIIIYPLHEKWVDIGNLQTYKKVR